MSDKTDDPGTTLAAPMLQGTAVSVPTAGGGRATIMATAFSGLIPTSIGEAYTLAGYLAKSSAIPKAYRGKPDNVFTVILAGLEVGLTPIRSLNNLTNISGNLGMKADLQLALVRRSWLLDFYDEGFELKGKTDADLASRAEDGTKILALVKAVPEGKPYGWATARRKGDANLTTRTFTWIDAETAEIWSKEDDDEGGGDRKKIKLSQKFNYLSFPADMYPKRARGRVLQVTHSDVLAGMLSTEALEGGQVIDITAEPSETPDDILAEAGDELAAAITMGFDALELSPARRTQKLVEYRGRFGDLVTWLRDEYTQRSGKGKGGTARKAKAAAAVIDAQAAPTVPQAQAAATDGYPAQVAIDAVAAAVAAVAAVTATPEPAKQAAEPVAQPQPNPKPTLVEPTKPAISPAASAAAKFRESFRTGATF